MYYSYVVLDKKKYDNLTNIKMIFGCWSIELYFILLHRLNSQM